MKNVLSSQAAKAEARKIGRDINDLQRARTSNGYDVRGKRLPRYSSSYRVAKRNMISGKWKFPRGSRVDPKWRARKVNHKGRLTGELFGSYTEVRPKVRRGENTIALEITLTTNSSRTRKRLRYLKEMGYDIFGLGREGTTRGRRERATVLRNSRKRIKASTRVKGLILTDD